LARAEIVLDGDGGSTKGKGKGRNHPYLMNEMGERGEKGNLSLGPHIIGGKMGGQGKEEGRATEEGPPILSRMFRQKNKPQGWQKRSKFQVWLKKQWREYVWEEKLLSQGGRNQEKGALRRWRERKGDAMTREKKRIRGVTRKGEQEWEQPFNRRGGGKKEMALKEVAK